MARFRFDIPQELIRELDTVMRRNLGPVVERIGEEGVAYAKRLCDEELTNDRPDKDHRRNLTAGKPHYRDSFKTGAPDLGGPTARRIRVVFYNDSPVADILEKGTPEHEIDGPGKFPFATTTAGGANYAATGKPKVSYGARLPAVQHPGTRPYKIVERTKTFLKQNKRQIQVLINTHLSM